MDFLPRLAAGMVFAIDRTGPDRTGANGGVHRIVRGVSAA